MFLTISHLLFAAAGFALGLYVLPILTAPKAPSIEAMSKASENVRYTAEFVKNLKSSDFLHWGEGKVSISDRFISLNGKIAPGPDYKLYLSPTFVEDEETFLSNKSTMLQIADVKTFNNFIVAIPASVNLDNYSTIIIWCESFGKFITAGQYRR